MTFSATPTTPLPGLRSPGERAFLWEKGDLARSAYERVWQVLGPLNPNPHTTRLFCHILLSPRLWGQADRTQLGPGWATVSSVLAKKEVRRAEIALLLDEGLVERSAYYVRPTQARRGKAYSFRVNATLRRDVVDRSLDAALSGSSDRVDAFTGSTWTSRRRKSSLNDPSRNPYPPLVRDALVSLGKGSCSRGSVKAHLLSLKAEADAAQAVVDALSPDAPDFASAEAESLRATGRLDNDLRCYETVLQQAGASRAETIDYTLAYSVQPSGRVSHVGGGLQSCSREMKEAAYSGIPDVHNYDLKSSQAHILRAYLQEASLDCGWIDEYLAAPRAKYDYADRVGLSVDAWKACLYAVFLGASLPTGRRSLGDILTIVQLDLAGRGRHGRLSPTLSALRSTLGPLRSAVQQWHRHLVGTWTDENRTTGRGGSVVTNAAGMRMRVLDADEAGYRRRLAAFVLQGQEAAFVHTLTALSTRYGFVPISNEHDGIVSLGTIPDQAVDEARRAVRMPYAQLVEKPFV